MQSDVSVVIPTYNRRAYLREAIASCFTGNEAVDVDVVVVDDGSEDGTREYLAALDDERVRPFLQEHQGAQVARNRGLDEARGEAVKFLDDDDRLLPGGLVDEYAALRESGREVTYGSVDKFFEETDSRAGCFTSAEHERLLTGLLRLEICRLPLAFMYRRSSLKGVCWDESLDYQQDWAFVLEAASRGLRCKKMDRAVAVHRIHRKERISDNRARDSTAFRIDRLAEMFWRAYRNLAARQTPSASIRRAAAAGLWKQAHKLAPFDFEGFRRWHKRAQRIDPAFRPSRSHVIIRALDRLASPAITERLMNPVRKAKARW